MTKKACPRPVLRALLIAGLALTSPLLLAPSAGAHAVLVGATPNWGAQVAATPGAITLRFSEEVVPRFARVAVLTARGENLALAPEVSGNIVSVPLRNGAAGSYTVRWQMVASDDGHVTQGAYSFGVRAKPLAPAPASGLAVPLAPELLAWVQFLGVVLAGGTLTFRALVSAPAARMLHDRSEREATVAVGVAVVGAVLALHAGLFGFLVGAYPIVGGGLPNLVNTQIIPIRVATHLGQAWTLMTFAWLGVLALLVGAWVTPRRREPLLAGAGVLSLGTAFGISWASHPAARGTLPLVADYVHLLAGALWVGGMVALAILAGVGRRASESAREALLRECLLRFSKVAVPAVVVLALAGAYVALRELPGPAALLSTGFGIMLLVKTTVFTGALGLGGYHRRTIAPRLAAGHPVASLRGTLAMELSLLLVALGLAAILSQLAPPT